jgi:ComF family protein
MDGLVNCLKYQGAVRKLLTKLKYSSVTEVVDELVELVISLADFTPLSHNTWIVMPVPLHKKRLRQRGFNQAAEIGKKLAKLQGWQYEEKSLERKIFTKPQVGLAREERLTNLQGVFEISKPDFCVKNASILLVDDVWTTGATMRECTKVLKRAGAQTVWGLAVAA